MDEETKARFLAIANTYVAPPKKRGPGRPAYSNKKRSAKSTGFLTTLRNELNKKNDIANKKIERLSLVQEQIILDIFNGKPLWVIKRFTPVQTLMEKEYLIFDKEDKMLKLTPKAKEWAVIKLERREKYE